MISGLLAASYYDGSIRLFDPRNKPASARVMMYREHTKPIVSCKSQICGKLVSGCTDGAVKVRIVIIYTFIITSGFATTHVVVSVRHPITY